MKQLKLFDDEMPKEEPELEIFDWAKEFPKCCDDNGNFEGFDVVIGNPPYMKEQDNKQVFRKIRKSGLWEEYLDGKMDLWYFFLHKAFDITNKTGLISYITNSYWVKSSGSQKLIKRIYRNKSLCEIVNLNDIPIFEKVVSKHMIHSYNKENINQTVKYRNITENSAIENIGKNPVETLNFEDIVKQTYINIHSEQDIQLSCKFSVLGSLYQVSQGVVEAPDKMNKKIGVFVINAKEYQQLNLNTNEKKIIKKYLNTSDVKRFKINWNKEYLIFSDKVNREMIKENKYPNLKKHLDKYAEHITSSNKPYGIHRDRSSIINPFEQPKLICKSMFKEPEFAYDEEKYYVSFSFSVIWQLDKNYDLKYLLGLLNSDFGKYWFTTNGKKRGVGVDIGVKKFREFPIPLVTKTNQKTIIKLVDKILKIKEKDPNADTSKLEKQIDAQVYKIYGLTDDDIRVIENETA